MQLGLASDVRAILLGAAAHAHPAEACGLLFGVASGETLEIQSATVARNVATDPARRFEVDPAHLFAVQRAARAGGPTPLGVWHSHPLGPARPSATDRAGITHPDWVWIIVAGGDLASWLPDAGAPGGFRALRILDLPSPLL